MQRSTAERRNRKQKGIELSFSFLEQWENSKEVRARGLGKERVVHKIRDKEKKSIKDFLGYCKGFDFYSQ